MLKSSPIFKRNGADLVEKKNVWKKQGLFTFKVWFVSNFGHVNFAINGKYFQKHYDNPNYYVSLVIFQTYKNVVLKTVHSLGWLLWLRFYPIE